MANLTTVDSVKRALAIGVNGTVNTYDDELNRLFFITASMKGMPVAVFHRFVDESATMTVKALWLFTIVDANGPEMNRSETVTILNDLCVLAPAALVHTAVQWQAVDDHSSIATLTRFDETVSATRASASATWPIRLSASTTERRLAMP